MSGFEILSALRKQKFPDCTQMAVDQLAAIFLRGGTSSIPGLANNGDSIEEQIVTEFILFKSAKKQLNAIQDLQVIEILLKFFDLQSNEAVRHELFKLLFSRTSNDERQLSLVTKFISMAVGLKSANVLNSVAVWMQSQGCNSDIVLHAIGDVVTDYTQFSDVSMSSLSQLPMVSAHFTCSFLTALTCIYSLPGSRSNKPVLTEQMLRLICDWLTAEPQLCIVSLYPAHMQHAQSQRAALWTSPTKPNTQTPVPGLVRWCSTAMLKRALDKRATLEDDSKAWDELWSRLHLLVLQTIVAFPSLPGARQLELVTLADMNQAVKDLVVHVQMVSGGGGGGKDDVIVRTAVDRLVQVLQVSLATGAFRCSLSDLKGICQRVPPCRLLKIVQSQHLSSAPPLMHNAS